MNYMEQVAKMLGVELGEEFEIDYGRGRMSTANITKTGLHIIKTNLVHIDGDINRVTLDWLLIGNCSIKRKPWKPHTNDTYYFVDEDGIVCEDVWLDVSDDILLYKCGNCYKTHAEAAQYGNKWYEFFKSDKMLEV